MSVHIQEPMRPGDRYYVAIHAAGTTKRIPADNERSARLIAAMAGGRSMMSPPKQYEGRKR